MRKEHSQVVSTNLIEGTGFHPPWMKNVQQKKSVNLISYDGLKYDPINIHSVRVSEQQAESLFCPSCDDPVVFKIRLEPCFHLLCFNCFETLERSSTKLCPSCGIEVKQAIGIPPNDSIFICSGKCCPTEWSSDGVGRVFLNLRSLKCHEMFFHCGKEEDGQDSTAQLDEVAVTNYSPVPDAHGNSNKEESNGFQDICITHDNKKERACLEKQKCPTEKQCISESHSFPPTMQYDFRSSTDNQNRVRDSALSDSDAGGLQHIDKSWLSGTHNTTYSELAFPNNSDHDERVGWGKLHTRDSTSQTPQQHTYSSTDIFTVLGDTAEIDTLEDLI